MAQHGWVFLLVAMLLNAPLLWRRARPHIAAHPELREGYRRLILWFTFWMSLPWLVMGFGCEVGGVPTVFHFLSPGGGPFVWAFWVVVYAESLFLGYWAVFRGGAETLVRHPGVINFYASSVPRMKWHVGGLAVWVVVWNTGFLVWRA